MSKDGVLEALFAEVSERSKRPVEFLVYDLIKPMSASKFYGYAYREISITLDKVFADPDFYAEHFKEFDCPKQYAKTALDDFEKEYAERIITLF